MPELLPPHQARAGVYAPINDRNPLEPLKLFGEGPTRLAYKEETPHVPAHFADPVAPSVCVFGFTTIKSRVKPVLDPTSEEKLREWELRMGREEAERIRTEAVAAGKLLHRKLECWLRGEPLGPCPLSQRPYGTGTGRGDLIPLSVDDLQPYRKEWEHWLNTFFELVGLSSTAPPLKAVF